MKNLEEIEAALRYIRTNLFPPSRFQLVKQNTDNITATYTLAKSIPLQYIPKIIENACYLTQNFRFMPSRKTICLPHSFAKVANFFKLTFKCNIAKGINHDS